MRGGSFPSPVTVSPTPGAGDTAHPRESCSCCRSKSGATPSASGTALEVIVIGRCLVGLFVLMLAASTETSAQKSSGLPRAIETAFRKAYPNATILHASRERRNGQVVYEVESRDGSTQRDLVYDLAGQALEIEET